MPNQIDVHVVGMERFQEACVKERDRLVGDIRRERDRAVQEIEDARDRAIAEIRRG